MKKKNSGSPNHLWVRMLSSLYFLPCALFPAGVYVSSRAPCMKAYLASVIIEAELSLYSFSIFFTCLAAHSRISCVPSMASILLMKTESPSSSFIAAYWGCILSLSSSFFFISCFTSLRELFMVVP